MVERKLREFKVLGSSPSTQTINGVWPNLVRHLVWVQIPMPRPLIIKCSNNDDLKSIQRAMSIVVIVEGAIENICDLICY